ncbi:helix-turn-helix domain-containing protein [Nitrogeniibacter aestuarii]|uniref:helix-turn-helix domain-containing protein n=1 Tax=Nitrogeniibacter aestuarii TaxID=2815343 RepID=UPI001E3FFEBE|nr:helix-turn-helix domain-containing protein [Nitrogeniibacter aestuarii]
MNSSAISFPRLLQALDQNLAQTTVLLGLIYRHGLTHEIEVSWSEIAALSPGLSRSTAHRATTALIEMGVVRDVTPSTAHSNTTRQFRVSKNAVQRLLKRAVPDANVIPGITEIPALDEFVGGISSNSDEVF